MRLLAAAATEKGLGRERNEDVYVLHVAQGLFAVCDGMGGASAGAIASQIAAATIVHELQQAKTAATAGALHEGPHRTQSCRLAEAVRESNRLIYTDGQQNPERCEMGTTVVSAWLQHDIASVAHVGDSRAYLWRDTHFQILTQDHTLLEALAGEGLDASCEELEEDPRDVLVRVVGREPEVDVDVVEAPVRTGDYLVLCTDGLTRVVSDTTMNASISRLREPQRICDYLVQTAARSGGTDDITVVVVQIVDAAGA
ncbi:MAG TPA: SpoIIE family protein phosphatase [Vicinamibacterales bacterium]|nr:SpoIIE family protein phosphatase [Vicinamibacterales bacterium]